MDGGGLVEQTLIDARLLPIARLEVRAQHTQVDQRELAPDQTRQQRREALTIDDWQRPPDRRENRRLHQRQRHRGGDPEDFPLMGEIVAAVGIAWINADLLLATEHQHRRPRHDQRP